MLDLNKYTVQQNEAIFIHFNTNAKTFSLIQLN